MTKRKTADWRDDREDRRAAVKAGDKIPRQFLRSEISTRVRNLTEGYSEVLVVPDHMSPTYAQKLAWAAAQHVGAKVKCERFVAVSPSTRETLDLVVVTKIPKEEAVV